MSQKLPYGTKTNTKRGVKYCPISIMRPDLESTTSWRIFLTTKLNKIEKLIFWPTIAFPKLQRFCADPYTSKIELKFRIRCFGTIRQLLRHYHFALSTKGVFHSTLLLISLHLCNSFENWCLSALYTLLHTAR